MSEKCEKCGQATEYQGWPNYETWAVKLWLDNEQPTQEYWFEQAREAKRQAPAADLVARGITTAEKAARYNLATQLKDELEEEAPDLGASMYTDLLGAALGRVDWYAIADALLEDLDEVGMDSDEEDNDEE